MRSCISETTSRKSWKYKKYKKYNNKYKKVDVDVKSRCGGRSRSRGESTRQMDAYECSYLPAPAPPRPACSACAGTCGTSYAPRRASLASGPPERRAPAIPPPVQIRSISRSAVQSLRISGLLERRADGQRRGTRLGEL